MTEPTPLPNARDAAPSAQALSEPASWTPTAYPSAVDLVTMIDVQRRKVRELGQSHDLPCHELRAHQNTLELLLRELRNRVPHPPTPEEERVHVIAQARQMANVLEFNVPASHRRNATGAAVTAAKRVVMKSLRPFNAEALRPQSLFNAKLVDALEELLRSEGAPNPGLIGRYRDELQSLAVPHRFQVQSHRGKVAGRTVDLAKQSYLKAMAPFIREALEKQHRWNTIALEVSCTTFREGRLPMQAATELLTPLEHGADILRDTELPRSLRPIWNELFRRQIEFNRIAARIFQIVHGAFAPAQVRQIDYQLWYAEREGLEIAQAAQKLESLEHRPLISLVVPAYETPEPILRKCIDSVLAQQYSNWELCIADDGSRTDAVRRVVSHYQKLDPRIQYSRLETNQGIAGATNAAIELAHGEYIAFLDHDDELRPHALSEVVAWLNDKPQTDLLYSDEDRIDAKGHRHSPFFKPDWSPDLLRSVNYICHFVVVSRPLLRSIGGLREGFQGSQDYDFLLRASEKARLIGHIPKVLYHWRNSEISLSRNEESLQRASKAGVRALHEHLERMGESAKVDDPKPTYYRVRYPVRGEPLVSIVVPFKDKVELLEQLLESMKLTAYQNWEMLLVSNNSVEPKTHRYLAGLTDPRVKKLEWNHPFNYPKINNYAANQATGDLILFLNNDIEVVDPLWLEELIAQAQRPEVGMVGAKLLFPNGTIQHAGVTVGMGGFAAHPFMRLPNTGVWTPFGHADWNRNYLAVTSACVMMRREVYERLKGFDERFDVCFSDVDIGVRAIELGLRVLYTAQTHLVHHESATRKLDAITENDFWTGFLALYPWVKRGDPFYNPNLSLSDADCCLRTDPRSAEELALATLSQRLESWTHTEAHTRALGQNHLIQHVQAVTHTAQELERARSEAPVRMRKLHQRGKIKRLLWALSPIPGGSGELHGLARVAEALARRHGVENHFVHMSNTPLLAGEARSGELLPSLPGPLHEVHPANGWASLPACDIAIASSWAGTHELLKRLPSTVRAYWVHDYEPLRYPAGTTYGMAELAFRLGSFGIFASRSLHDFITQRHPMQGVWLEPAVDNELFHAARPPRQGPTRLLFHGCPTVDKTGFELGLAVLSQLKAALGSRVEITCVGERWSPEHYGLVGKVVNLGALPYAKSGDYYRQTDVALVFNFTRQPTAATLELMACGVTVVSNENPAHEWLLQHDRNCALAAPMVGALRPQLERVIADAALRERLGSAAAERMQQTSYLEQADRLYHALCGSNVAVLSQASGR